MVVITVAAIIAYFVPSLRKRVVVQLRQAREALGVLTSGRKLLELFGGTSCHRCSLR